MRISADIRWWLCPVLYMESEGVKEALEKYVEQGGVLVTTYMSGYCGSIG